ncbi:unnamed protein product [Effrenium voratum]|nr:unnamed protein product [Effrenium voratum]
MDHFREYDKWPWQRFSSLERQLGDHPSFVLAEVLFISLSCFAFLHAACESNPKEGRRLMLIWFATFIVGTVNDYIFMLLPVVDNFWQAQGLVMLTPRMPLYIPCVYNAFMYWPTVSAARVFYHARQSALAEAGLAGLLAVIFYAPYDMCGARFLWWSWHETDPGVALRWLGVPGGSTAWTITFTFCFSLLLRLGSDCGWSQTKTLALACWSTPLMLVVLNLCTVIGLDRIGMPGPQTVLAAAVCCIALVVAAPKLKAWPERKANPLNGPEHWSVRTAMCTYFMTLILVGLLFSPEKQVSTGVHQQFGPCDATDVDLMGYERKRYICRDRFPSAYFHFNCTASLEASGRWARVAPEEGMRDGVSSWYTICGQPHADFRSWLGGLLLLCAAGTLLFVLAMSSKVSPDEVPALSTSESQMTQEAAAEKLRQRSRTSTPRKGK